MFIFVYRLTMDAKTLRGDGVGGLKYLSLLKDFQTCTASMARKRHLASIARGFYCFCLMARIWGQEVQDVQMVQEVQKVQGVQLRPIRILLARMKERHT